MALVDHGLGRRSRSFEIGVQRGIEHGRDLVIGSDRPAGAVLGQEGSLGLGCDQQRCADGRRLQRRQRRLFVVCRGDGEQARTSIGAVPILTVDRAGEARTPIDAELPRQQPVGLEGSVVASGHDEPRVGMSAYHFGEGPEEAVDTFQRVDATEKEDGPGSCRDAQIDVRSLAL